LVGFYAFETFKFGWRIHTQSLEVLLLLPQDRLHALGLHVSWDRWNRRAPYAEPLQASLVDTDRREKAFVVGRDRAVGGSSHGSVSSLLARMLVSFDLIVSYKVLSRWLSVLIAVHLVLQTTQLVLQTLYAVEEQAELRLGLSCHWRLNGWPHLLLRRNELLWPHSLRIGFK